MGDISMIEFGDWISTLISYQRSVIGMVEYVAVVVDDERVAVDTQLIFSRILKKGFNRHD